MGGAAGFDIDRLAGAADDFALVYRPAVSGDRVEVLTGTTRPFDRLADLPVRPCPVGTQLLVAVPFRQAAERGFRCHDDGTPLLAMEVTGRAMVSREVALQRLPRRPVLVGAGRFDLDDADYADVVRRVTATEIGRGTGANFVIRRSFQASWPGHGVDDALSVYRRLLVAEHGAYWTFLVRIGGRMLIGASPEMHLRMAGGVVTMNPISGTYRYGKAGPTARDALRFLADEKEVDELFMVVDEELKMMSRVCTDGGRVLGPRLKQMAHLAHTEYLLQGRSELDAREVLRETMFAPTVTGSPVENAFRVIARHETTGRGYYGGVLALLGTDGSGRSTLDSAILIRTAEIDRHGHLTIGVGATLVRHSDPVAEAAETTAKAAALIEAMHGAQHARTMPAPDGSVGPGPDGSAGPGPDGSAGSTRVGRVAAVLGDDPVVRRALRERNDRLAPFWRQDPRERVRPVGPLLGRRVLVVDAEDRFTLMLADQIRALGPTVRVVRFDEPVPVSGWDLVVVGPGPGDPREHDDPRIAALRALTRRLLATGQPFLSICLGHQILAGVLGFDVVRRPVPNQGRQRDINLFGQWRRGGFYNTFAARVGGDPDGTGRHGRVQASYDARTGEIDALRGPHFRSLQFHPESVLSVDGLSVLTETLQALLPADRPTGEPLGAST